MKSKKIVMVATFPSLMTLGKLVNNRTPVETLKVFDDLEERYGKKTSFNGMKIMGRVTNLDPSVKENHKTLKSKMKKTFKRLIDCGLIEQPNDNALKPIDKRVYRLTNLARHSLKYV